MSYVIMAEQERKDARNDVSTTSNGALARLAVPDTGSLALDGGLSAEGASVLGVLGDFHLLDLLSQGSTVARECQFPWSFDSIQP